jgi:diacylglycerol O-acyltransferase
VVDRTSALDMMQLATDVGPAPAQVGAALVFAPGTTLGVAEARDALADRVRGIPRLRQRLVPTPPGCGRPIWVDDARFDIARHIRAVPCPPPGDEEALLEAAAEVVTHPLPPDRPLWSATLVTGVVPGTRALVLVFHHVLADGIGGLAVLAGLVDGLAPTAAGEFPVPRPPWRRVAWDAAAGRLRALARLGAAPGRLRDALAELRAGGSPPAPRCSLNRPVGPRRRYRVARAELARVRAAGHEHGATVNDVVLAAVGGALGSLLAWRGEQVDHVVASVPVSGRVQATGTQLGNQVGAMSVVLPTSGPAPDRLRAIARLTRERKAVGRASSAAVMVPVVRALAAVGALRWVIEHQHLATTFVTNLHGPDARLSFLGSAITEVIPLTEVAGNVPIAFAVLSYAGTVTVTVIVDPDAVPDSATLVDAFGRELAAVAPAAPS